MIVIPAVFDLLVQDTTLTAQLGSYQNAPCVFNNLLPEDAPRPYVWISAYLRNRRWGSKLERGREVSLEVWCAADNDGSTVVIDAIADRLLQIFEHQEISLGSIGTLVTTEVLGPVGLETDEVMLGRKVIVTFRVI